MPHLDLHPRHRAILEALLDAHVSGAAVWAYGSRVNGKSHEGSDLDLVVLNPEDPDIPVKNLAGLRTALSESNLPILVDVMDWAAVPAAFRAEIEKNHVVLRN